jgi:hypothetical protein
VKTSKYAIDPEEIFSMKEQQLRSYIKLGWKSIQTKIRRTKKSEFADFSELLQDLEEIEGRIGKLSGATAGLSFQQLRRKALGINQLFRITETPAQLEREGFDNIRNFFREPRFTRQFIEGIHRNQTILRKLANKNDKFIRDILSSEQIAEIVEENRDNPDEMYRKLLTATSDMLDMYEDEEKEAALEEWDPVYKYGGDNTWIEEESGEVVDVFSEWKWGI